MKRQTRTTHSLLKQQGMQLYSYLSHFREILITRFFAIPSIVFAFTCGTFSELFGTLFDVQVDRGQNTSSHLRMFRVNFGNILKLEEFCDSESKSLEIFRSSQGRLASLFFFLVRYWIGPVVGTQNQNSYDVIKTWADNINQKLSKYGIFPQGPEAEKVMQRLKELKVKYDPENVFHQNVNIDPKKEQAFSQVV